MNVITFATPQGDITFTERQVEIIRKAGAPLPQNPAPAPGVPDFTDGEVYMILEDGGDVSRALANRKYH